MTTPLTVVTVGCGGMGAGHARLLAKMPAYKLLAVCDRVPELAQKTAQSVGAAAAGDFAAALALHRPDVACVLTDNKSHYPLARLAVEAGVRGLVVEKPMTVDPADARAMVALCRERNVALMVNHQRRMGVDLLEMKRLMDSGALGTIRSIRVQCAGDFISDGTHLVDSAQFLTGDQMPEWVQGALRRDMPALTASWKPSSQTDKPGYRFNHPTESGLMAVWQFPGGGPRVEAFGGDWIPAYCAYQDYMISGDRGRLWRAGDVIGNNLFIADGRPGTHSPNQDDWPYLPRPDASGSGEWRPVPLDSEAIARYVNEKDGYVLCTNTMETAYTALADTVLTGKAHPMSGEVALKGFEIVTAAYESARLGRRLAPPVAQDRFPLALMVEGGQA